LTALTFNVIKAPRLNPPTKAPRPNNSNTWVISANSIHRGHDLRQGVRVRPAWPLVAALATAPGLRAPDLRVVAAAAVVAALTATDLGCRLLKVTGVVHLGHPQ
jgi:hypothetical protein